jgi:hypothetical protein
VRWFSAIRQTVFLGLEPKNAIGWRPKALVRQTHCNSRDKPELSLFHAERSMGLEPKNAIGLAP